MTSTEFINNFIISHAGELQKKKFFLASVTILTIGLEIAGGFFDNKPLKSPKQSKIRFRAATNKLLSAKYAVVNRDDFLYETLRNQLLHSLIPGKTIVFDLSARENHLTLINNTILFNPQIFLSDVEEGIIKLRKLIQEGKVKEKRIPDNSNEIKKWIV